EKRNSEQKIVLKSALSIVFDFLTVPEMLGTRAYALVSMRNFLFQQLNTVPESSQPRLQQTPKFSAKDIRDSISVIVTSTRERFYSKGEDKLPAEGKSASDALVRHFLA